mgnify:FL=1
MCERKSARRGAIGERLAAAYFGRLGCRVLEMNFRTRRGEIDVIAQKGDMLIFAEVKTRDEAAAAQPAEAVTAQKRRRIVLAAQGYLLLHPELAENFMRFDVVEVTVPRLGTPRLNCIENAFTL